MPQIENSQFAYQETLERIPSGTSRSSNALCQAALFSLETSQVDTGTSAANTALQQTALRTFNGVYSGFVGTSFPEQSIKEVSRRKILPTLIEISNLLSWPVNWNSYGACAPKYEAVQYADHWIELYYQEVVDSEQVWLEPNVTASADGEVVFEWRQDIKALTIYIGNQSAEYVKDWGADINTEMENGYANSPQIRRTLWKWLMS